MKKKGEEVGGADSFLGASQFFHICSAGLYVKIHLEPLRRFTSTPSAQEELHTLTHTLVIFHTVVWRMTKREVISITPTHSVTNV